jgi:hypothetical protein
LNTFSRSSTHLVVGFHLTMLHNNCSCLVQTDWRSVWVDHFDWPLSRWCAYSAFLFFYTCFSFSGRRIRLRSFVSQFHVEPFCLGWWRMQQCHGIGLRKWRCKFVIRHENINIWPLTG